ncbi:putative NDP-hexose isomerase [Streptomyces albireticuli]|uniref:Putative NDP-hexose isomerase n=1 Tax=Streptomyces albireticuli TaxID=1940 RepID=A0A1Z2KZ34_9ACTN|nr:FdtA/QdtA family cupin domain-containing protein [Streptomyces albireticuli]ARZ67319.1 putative NDP-hexose isomerase [Streptomyces albireticuli]
MELTGPPAPGSAVRAGRGAAPRPERSAAIAEKTAGQPAKAPAHESAPGPEGAAGAPDPGPVGRVKPCRLIRLEQHIDPRGSLSVVESGMTVDFAIERVYYMHGQAASSPPRGLHGHRTLEQLVIAVHGGFSISLDDGFRRATYRLDEPGAGLYIGPMVWRVLKDFAPDSVALVLASRHYEESDYYRDYDTFLRDARSLT